MFIASVLILPPSLWHQDRPTNGWGLPSRTMVESGDEIVRFVGDLSRPEGCVAERAAARLMNVAIASSENPKAIVDAGAIPLLERLASSSKGLEAFYVKRALNRLK
jgi:hypothetical protein